MQVLISYFFITSTSKYKNIVSWYSILNRLKSKEIFAHLYFFSESINGYYTIENLMSFQVLENRFVQKIIYNEWTTYITYLMHGFMYIFFESLFSWFTFNNLRRTVIIHYQQTCIPSNLRKTDNPQKLPLGNKNDPIV